MVRTDRDEFLRRVSNELTAFPNLEVAMVFGSVARASATPRSDLDVAVWGQVDPLSIAAHLSTVLGREVDVVRIEGAPVPLIDSLVRDAIVVYEREPGAGAIVRSRLLTSLEIDRPWYERMQNAWLARVAKGGILG